MKIKICFVTTTSISIESFILPCVDELNKKGFEVYFVTSCKKGFKESCPPNVKVYDFTVSRGFDLLGTFSAARKFKKLCLAEKFDMVVYATPNGALYGSIGAKAAKVPCRILAQWGMRYVGFEGLKRHFVRSIEKISCRKSTDIRNVSNKNRELAINDGMYKAEKCKVLGSGGTIGVDLTRYKLEDIPQHRKAIRHLYDIPEESVVFSFVGRICRDKGVAELLEAFEWIYQNDNNCYLMLIGGIDDNSMLPKSILEKARTNPNIVFCGAVPNVKVSEYLSAADILVHPTYREGFGMVLQEAAALALPTITTNIPGASEAIVNEKTGLLAEKGDTESLKNAMHKMLDQELRFTFGKAGRKRIEEEFDRTMMIERMVNDYLEIYHTRTVNLKSTKGK